MTASCRSQAPSWGSRPTPRLPPACALRAAGGRGIAPSRALTSACGLRSAAAAPPRLSGCALRRSVLRGRMPPAPPSFFRSLRGFLPFMASVTPAAARRPQGARPQFCRRFLRPFCRLLAADGFTTAKGKNPLRSLAGLPPRTPSIGGVPLKLPSRCRRLPPPRGAPAPHPVYSLRSIGRRAPTSRGCPLPRGAPAPHPVCRRCFPTVPPCVKIYYFKQEI